MYDITHLIQQQHLQKTQRQLALEMLFFERGLDSCCLCVTRLLPERPSKLTGLQPKGQKPLDVRLN